MTIDDQATKQGTSGIGEQPLMKISFLLAEEEEWPDVGSESMWAKQLSAETAELLNVPFHKYGLSYGDVVRFVVTDEGMPQYAGIVSRGGHSTYRLILHSKRYEEKEVLDCLEELQGLGCDLEFFDDKFVAVDVLPSTDIQRVFEFLTARELQGIWKFEESHLGHSGREPANDKSGKEAPLGN